MAPGLTTIKSLFALSGNTCSYMSCEETLTHPAWNEVAAEIAHICGQSPKWARFDPEMSPTERDGFGNLMLLCAKHHKLIDRLEPESHSVKLLQQMKADHERASYRDSITAWADDAALDRFARMLMAAAESDTSDDRRSVPRGVHFSRWLVATRQGHGLTVAALAEQVGCSTSSVARWESGVAIPMDFKFYQGLAEAFDVSVGELLQLAEDDRAERPPRAGEKPRMRRDV